MVYGLKERSKLKEEASLALKAVAGLSDSGATRPVDSAGGNPAAPGFPAGQSQLAEPIVASLPEGVVVCDRQLRYGVWNQFMEQISGHPAAEVRGQPRSAVLFGAAALAPRGSAWRGSGLHLLRHDERCPIGSGEQWVGGVVADEPFGLGVHLQEDAQRGLVQLQVHAVARQVLLKPRQRFQGG